MILHACTTVKYILSLSCAIIQLNIIGSNCMYIYILANPPSGLLFHYMFLSKIGTNWVECLHGDVRTPFVSTARMHRYNI